MGYIFFPGIIRWHSPLVLCLHGSSYGRHPNTPVQHCCHRSYFHLVFHAFPWLSHFLSLSCMRFSRFLHTECFASNSQIASWDPNISCYPGSYKVCGSCERVLSDESTSYGPNVHPCEFCRRRPRNPNAPRTKHLYKLLVSSFWVPNSSVPNC